MPADFAICLSLQLESLGSKATLEEKSKGEEPAGNRIEENHSFTKVFFCPVDIQQLTFSVDLITSSWSGE